MAVTATVGSGAFLLGLLFGYLLSRIRKTVRIKIGFNLEHEANVQNRKEEE